MSYLHGKFVWFEHMSNNPQAAQRFYTQLFGWTVEKFDMGGEPYQMIQTGGTGIGGFLNAPAGVASNWTSYLSVADVDASARAAQAAGGKIVLPPTDFPPVGRGAALLDPTGAAFSIWKSAQGDAPDIDPVPIGHWYWNELSTTDAKKALAFYEKVFGFTHDTMDMGAQGSYYMLVKDGQMRAGLWTAPADVPTMWLPYVLVAECDATLAKAKQLGALEYKEATDIPNVGRFAIVGDPTGAAIAFMNRA
jgi:hypothetical protein